MDEPAAGSARPRRRARLLPALSLAASALLLLLLAQVVRQANRPAGDEVRFGAVSGPPIPAETFRPGTAAKPLRLAALGGGTLDLAAYRGRPVIVNFWASWCDPCKRELPLLRDTLAKHGAERLAVVGVVVRDSPASAAGFASRAGAGWPMGIDRDERAAGAWGVANLPQTFFVRPDGTLASRQLGELHAQALEAQIAAIAG